MAGRDWAWKVSGPRDDEPDGGIISMKVASDLFEHSVNMVRELDRRKH